jgi:hypothetical protein
MVSPVPQNGFVAGLYWFRAKSGSKLGARQRKKVLNGAASGAMAAEQSLGITPATHSRTDAPFGSTNVLSFN